MLINRMNGTQAAVWFLGSGAAPVPADAAGYTDVTEATLFLALFGPRVFEVTEHLTNLDLGTPQRRTPFLLQGPLAHVPCQAVVLARGEDGSGGMLLACSRGYAHDMVHVILSAGAAHGLRPAGENRFKTWLADLDRHQAGPNHRQ
jgi:glycine cleavage system aminomethyltransferase T